MDNTFYRVGEGKLLVVVAVNAYFFARQVLPEQFDQVFNLLAVQGAETIDHINGADRSLCELRKLGDPLLPFVRFDASYLAIEPDVDAFDYRIQLGYGTFAFELNQTRHEEKEPPDQLDFYCLYGLVRLSYGDKVKVDLGVGSITLEGNEQNSGFSTTMPILVQPYDWLIVEFRPMWSNINGSAIGECELSFLFNYDFAAIKAGYRRTHSPHDPPDGPFIGLSIRY